MSEPGFIEIDMRGMTDGQADAALERAQSQRSAAPIFHRPPVEKYVRVTIDFGGFTYEPAVEWREGDGFYEMTQSLEGIALCASLEGTHSERKASDAMKQAEMVGALIAGGWPDRAYFVEVWHGERKGFAQVVQPYGVPRNR